MRIHALDVPILIGEQPVIMHRVVEGEQTLSITEQYQTTVKVLEWVNSSPPVPLWAGKVIIIAPGLKEVDPSLPPFEAYEVKDAEISIQSLANMRGIDLEKLKYYNHCTESCVFVKGDWLLLPPATDLPLQNTPTLRPTSAPTAKNHTLDAPIPVGDRTLLMHRIAEGEQVITLTKQYQTTIEVLEEINFKPAIPLWAGKVIIIAPGLIVNVDPEFPAFEAFEVVDKEISIEDLSLKLGADLALLKYYNNCPDGCLLVKGDWLLVPRPKQQP